MFCSSCGAQLAEALSYCNRCGASVRSLTSAQDEKAADTTIDSLVWVIVGTTITILGMCLGALVLMQDKRIDFALGTIFVILSFTAFLLVEGALVWRLMKLTKRSKEKRGFARPRDTEPAELGAVPTNALPESVMPSVTEQTTRTLEPSYRKDDQ